MMRWCFSLRSQTGEVCIAHLRSKSAPEDMSIITTGGKKVRNHPRRDAGANADWTAEMGTEDYCLRYLHRDQAL